MVKQVAWENVQQSFRSYASGGGRGSRSETGVVTDEIEITINNDIAANELIPELQTARERKGFMTLEGHEVCTRLFQYRRGD